jgi:hypothetical protein
MRRERGDHNAMLYTHECPVHAPYVVTCGRCSAFVTISRLFFPFSSAVAMNIMTHPSSKVKAATASVDKGQVFEPQAWLLSHQQLTGNLQ